MKRINISDTYRIQELMMSIMGVWHKETYTTTYKIRRFVTWLVFIVAYAAMIMQFFHVITDFEQLCQILYMMTSYTSYFFKMVGYSCNRKAFLGLLRQLEDPIFVSYPRHLEVHISRVMNISIFITKMYRFSCGSVVILFCVYPLVDNKSLPTPFPFELGPYTPLMYAVQSFALLIAAWNNFCLDTLCASLMGLAASEFDVLKYKIAAVREFATEKLKVPNTDTSNAGVLPEVDDMVVKLLRNCIRHHNAVITLVESIEKIFSFGLLTQLLGSIVVICNTGFFLLLVSPASFQFGLLSTYFITMMAQLSLYCWYGNEIILKSIEIRDACYLSNWYSCGQEVKKMLFLIMERSKRPLEITAWKFSNLSLSTFSAIIQWSYSYFALLQRLAKKKDTF